MTVVSVRARPCEGDTLTRHDVLLCFLFPSTPLPLFFSPRCEVKEAGPKETPFPVILKNDKEKGTHVRIILTYTSSYSSTGYMMPPSKGHLRFFRTCSLIHLTQTPTHSHNSLARPTPPLRCILFLVSAHTLHHICSSPSL